MYHPQDKIKVFLVKIDVPDALPPSLISQIENGENLMLEVTTCFGFSKIKL
jgi:hypothetical protein